MVWSPLTTHVMENTDDRASRGGARIDSIGHHHTALPSRDGALDAFRPGGREVTPNYCIWEDEIWGIVPEEFRAYTSGSAQDDARSITYEIVNSTGAPDWRISDRTLATVARLDAEISARYGIQRVHSLPGFWEHRNLNEWFGRSYSTACAGPGFNINSVIAATIAETNGVIDMATGNFPRNSKTGTIYWEREPGAPLYAISAAEWKQLDGTYVDFTPAVMDDWIKRVGLVSTPALAVAPVTVSLGNVSIPPADNAEVIAAIQALGNLIAGLPAEIDRYADGRKQAS